MSLVLSKIVSQYASPMHSPRTYACVGCTLAMTVSKHDQRKFPTDILAPTSKSPDTRQILQSHDLRMLNPWTPTRRDIGWISGTHNDIFKNIQNGIIRPIADAMDIL